MLAKVQSQLFYNRLDYLSLWVNTNYSDSIYKRKEVLKPYTSCFKGHFSSFYAQNMLKYDILTAKYLHISKKFPCFAGARVETGLETISRQRINNATSRPIVSSRPIIPSSLIVPHSRILPRNTFKEFVQGTCPRNLSKEPIQGSFQMENIHS